MTLELNHTTREFIKKKYMEALEATASELKMQPGFNHLDTEAIAMLQGQKILSDSFAGITNMAAREIRKIITNAYNDPKGINLNTLNEEIKRVSNVADFHAELIARTETGKVSAAARYNSYKKVDAGRTFRYKHIGPSDHRTTDACKRIAEKTKNGVSWDDYVAIMKSESKQDFPDWDVNELFPVAHYQCRHTFLRIQ